MADESAVGDHKLKVFISYSHKDEEFAQELLAGLELAGFEPYFDKQDIAAGEDWEARLGLGISLVYHEGHTPQPSHWHASIDAYSSLTVSYVAMQAKMPITE